MPAPSFRVTSSAGPRLMRARQEPQISDKRTRSLHTDQSAEIGGDETAFLSWPNEPHRSRIADAPSPLDNTSKWLASDAEEISWSAETATPAEEWTHGHSAVANADEGQVLLDLIAEPCWPAQIQEFRNRHCTALTSPLLWYGVAESPPRNPDLTGGSKPTGIYDTILRMSDLESHLTRQRHDIPWPSNFWQARWDANPQEYGPSATEFRNSPAMQMIVNKVAHFNELVEAWSESAALFERVSIQGKKNSELEAEARRLGLLEAVTSGCRSIDAKELEKQRAKIEKLQEELDRCENSFEGTGSSSNSSANDLSEQREIAVLRRELQNSQRERDQVQKSFDKLVGDMTRSLNEVNQGREQESR